MSAANAVLPVSVDTVVALDMVVRLKQASKSVGKRNEKEDRHDDGVILSCKLFVGGGRHDRGEGGPRFVFFYGRVSPAK